MHTDVPVAVVTGSGTAQNAVSGIRQFTVPIGALDLESTLDGGQAFRWWRADGVQGVAYDGVIGSTAVRVSEVPGRDSASTSATIRVEVRSNHAPPGLPDEVAGYLGAGSALDELQAQFAADRCIGPAIAGFPGLRLLRQEPWECLVSFICSSTSNIPRIKLNVGSVARELGERVGPGRADYAFPQPGVIAAAGERFLRDLGLGFRAKYIIPAAEAVASGELDLMSLRDTSYEDARSALVRLNGVGEKVADCVLAFSLDKPEAFPVDRHIRRALERWYGLPAGVNNAKASDFARARFGRFGAVAQQYMFHRERLAQRAKWGGSHAGMALPQDRV
jgi:N-glycosylase/DNA lyase